MDKQIEIRIHRFFYRSYREMRELGLMAFDNFTRVDYITLNQGKGGWKVSKVETTYP